MEKQFKETVPSDLDLHYRVEHTGLLARPFFDLTNKRLKLAIKHTKPEEFFLVTIRDRFGKQVTRGGTREDAQNELILRN